MCWVIVSSFARLFYSIFCCTSSIYVWNTTERIACTSNIPFSRESHSMHCIVCNLNSLCVMAQMFQSLFYGPTMHRYAVDSILSRSNMPLHRMRRICDGSPRTHLSSATHRFRAYSIERSHLNTSCVESPTKWNDRDDKQLRRNVAEKWTVKSKRKKGQCGYPVGCGPSTVRRSHCGHSARYKTTPNNLMFS